MTVNISLQRKRGKSTELETSYICDFENKTIFGFSVYNFICYIQLNKQQTSSCYLWFIFSDCSGMPGILREKSELEGRLSLDYRRQSHLSLLRQELEK